MRPMSSAFGAVTCISAALLLTAAADALKPSVREVGRMGMARAAHSATLLPDGSVLVAGGCTADGCETGADGATAELYDARARRFRAAGRMASVRAGHTATLLPNGRVLLAGGWNGSRQLTTAEVYDPATRTFRAAGSLAQARGGHTATLLRDGRVLLVGGDGGARTAEVYDPRTGRFTATAAMAAGRQGHTAALLADGRVLVAGGSAGRGAVHATAEVFDPRTGRWARTGEMATARHKHGAVTLRDGRVLVMGGSDARDWRGRYATAELYDPATGRFTPAGSMHQARFKLGGAVVGLENGAVLVAGGAPRTEMYFAQNSEFAMPHGGLDSPWHFSTATRLADGGVLIVGGYDDRLRLTPRAWVVQ